MLKDVKDIKSFIKWARLNGVVSCKVGELEFVLDPSKLKDKDKPEKPAAGYKDTWAEEFNKILDENEEQDLLFHSSGG